MPGVEVVVERLVLVAPLVVRHEELAAAAVAADQYESSQTMRPPKLQCNKLVMVKKLSPNCGWVPRFIRACTRACAGVAAFVGGDDPAQTIRP